MLSYKELKVPEDRRTKVEMALEKHGGFGRYS